MADRTLAGYERLADLELRSGWMADAVLGLIALVAAGALAKKKIGRVSGTFAILTPLLGIGARRAISRGMGELGLWAFATEFRNERAGILHAFMPFAWTRTLAESQDADMRRLTPLWGNLWEPFSGRHDWEIKGPKSEVTHAWMLVFANACVENAKPGSTKEQFISIKRKLAALNLHYLQELRTTNPNPNMSAYDCLMKSLSEPGAIQAWCNPSVKMGDASLPFPQIS